MEHIDIYTVFNVDVLLKDKPFPFQPVPFQWHQLE